VIHVFASRKCNFTIKLFLGLVIGWRILPSTCLAQNNTGEIRLSVSDNTGRPVPASVELVSEATKTHQAVNLPDTGQYSFKNLPFGQYVLTVNKPGFATSSELLDIHSVLPQSHNLKLTVQPVQTSVEVKETATLVDEDRTAAAYYTGSREIEERRTTTPGRGLIDLAAMQPGWTLEANGILHPRESEYDVQYVVNGFPVEDNRSPAFARPLDADDVTSMKQYASGIPAEFGDKLGGVIELNTTRNTSPGFHGVYIAQGGSFDTLSSYLSGQYVTGNTTVSASGEGFLTDRYLDPPTEDNFTNHASSTSFTGSIEHDFGDADRLRVSILNQQTWLQVPDDLLQAAAGQRQDRTSASTDGQVSYQHVFSPSLVGSIRASVRDVSADLWSNPLSTPIIASQDRNYREAYWDVSLAGHSGFNEWKAGTQGRYASANEKFAYDIVAYDIDGQPVFDSDTPPSFRFSGHKPDREQAVYGQDVLHFRNLTVNLGLRFDHYDFVVDQTGWSPRAGLAYNIQKIGLVLHASYDRTFGTPPFENLLVSSAPETRFGEGVYLPLEPSRGNYYEVGFTKAIGGRLRLEANWFRRNVTNFEDDDLLVNTGVSFPIAYKKATVRGTEVKLEVPRWGRFSGFLGYANTIGIGQLPIAGGLFLDDGSAALLNAMDKFPISQDIRNAVNGYVRCQILPRLWTAWTASYTSGLPVEDAGDLPDRDFLVAQYGESVVDSVNFPRGRVHPSFSLNASVGMDLFRRERAKVSLQADITNITDRLNVINFAGLLSGTAIGPPRSASGRLRLDF
jgi:Carboxypeptidase regulatory-like domain